MTVLRYCRELYIAKAAHISEWGKDKRGRDIMKIYKLGAAKDAKRERMTPVERQRRLRAKQKMQAQLRMMAGALKEAA